MASNLQEEVNCPICMDTLKEPVTTECGHTFCFTCIGNVGIASDRLLQCPLCKEPIRRNVFKTNWLVMRLVEKIQAMASTEHPPEDQELRCQKHGERLFYFCEHDGALLCTVCREAKDHKSHRISLIEEAAQDYQVQIQRQVEVLEQMEEEIMQEKVLGEQTLCDSMAWVLQEKEKVLQEFKSLQESVENAEKALLSRLSCLEQEVTERKERYIADTEEQLDSLRMFTETLKAKLQMLPLQLLEDIKEILSWSEGFQLHNSTGVPPDVADKISEAQTRHDSIIKNLKNFRGYLLKENDPEPPISEPSELPLERSRDPDWEVPGAQGSREPAGSLGTDHLWRSPEPVTLDAASAHPQLALSPDLRTVALGPAPPGDPQAPADPARFFPLLGLLGRPGLSGGRRSWEAELQGAGGVACVVGVASEFAARRGFVLLEPQAGFWVLRFSDAGCQALTDGGAPETLPRSPRRVGVVVDHERGEVAFYDALACRRLYTFRASFPGQVFPFFGLLNAGTRITLSP